LYFYVINKIKKNELMKINLNTHLKLIDTHTNTPRIWIKKQIP